MATLRFILSKVYTVICWVKQSRKHDWFQGFREPQFLTPAILLLHFVDITVASQRFSRFSGSKCSNMFQCFLISWGSNKQKFTSSIVVKESYQLFPVKNCKHHESPSITIHDIRARMTTCSTQPTTLALPSPGFKLPCPLQQGKMSLSTAILSM